MSKISLLWGLFKDVTPGELGVAVKSGGESARIIDLESSIVGISSESESAGVIVGGAGCDV